MTRLKWILGTIAGLTAPLWAVVLLIVVQPQNDPDYWWHLRIGEWITGHGEIPRSALLSWLAQGPWTAHEWGGEVLLYWLHGLIGPFGSIVLLGAVNVGAVLLMVSTFRLLRPRSNHLAEAGLAVLAVFVATPIWSPRLQAFDLLFGLLALRVALGYLERRERRGLVLMPLVMLAWVNLHGGGVAIYPIIMTAIFAGEWWNRRGRPVAGPAWKPLLASFGATILAMSFNPIGPAIYLYPFSTVFSPVMQDLILEWQSPNFHSLALRFAQFFIVGLIGLLALVRVRDARALLLTSGFAFMFLQSGRYVGFFALISIAVMSPYLVAAAEKAWCTIAGRPFTWYEPRYPIMRIITTGLVITLLVGGAGRLPAAQTTVVAANQPVVAADWLLMHPQDGRMFNDYDWGGYLSYRLQIPVGFYGAADAFGDANLEALGQLLVLEIDPQAYLDAHGVTLVITRPSEPLGHWLAISPGWQRLYAGGTAVIFARARPLTP